MKRFLNARGVTSGSARHTAPRLATLVRQRELHLLETNFNYLLLYDNTFKSARESKRGNDRERKSERAGEGNRETCIQHWHAKEKAIQLPYIVHGSSSSRRRRRRRSEVVEEEEEEIVELAVANTHSLSKKYTLLVRRSISLLLDNKNSTS